MTAEQLWKNRIVGHADVDPKTLVAHPLNFRRHPKAQADATTGSLNELGWIQDVLVSKGSGKIIDGHLRVELALQHGEKSVPVKYVELSESEERLALAVLDPLTYMAETDAAALEELLRGVETGDAALSDLLAKMAEDEGIVPPQDVDDLWQGMPEFENEPRAFRSIAVHFKTSEDAISFAALIEQPITDKTRYLWFPPQPGMSNKNLRYENES